MHHYVRFGSHLARAANRGPRAHGGVHPPGRAINPISKINWEGTGVVPDVKVDAEDALRTAERLALTELLKSLANEGHAQRLRQRLAELT